MKSEKRRAQHFGGPYDGTIYETEGNLPPWLTYPPTDESPFSHCYELEQSHDGRSIYRYRHRMRVEYLPYEAGE